MARELEKRLEEIEAKLDALEDRQLANKLSMLEFRDELKAWKEAMPPVVKEVRVKAKPEKVPEQKILNEISRLRDESERLRDSIAELDVIKGNVKKNAEEIERLKKTIGVKKPLPKNVCQRCAAINEPDAKFCDRCGKKL